MKKSRHFNSRVEQRYVERLRGLGMAGRLKIGFCIFDFAREVTTAGVGAAHPDWTPEEMRQAVRRRMQILDTGYLEKWIREVGLQV